MTKRGWTEQSIREALATPGIPADGKHGSAMRHVHPTTGKSVVVDNATGEIFHGVAKGLSMSEEIYIPLLDEGLNVWRPAPAWKINADTYIVLRPENYDSVDEHWEFPPASVVVCEEKKHAGRTILAAVRMKPAKRQTA